MRFIIKNKIFFIVLIIVFIFINNNSVFSSAISNFTLSITSSFPNAPTNLAGTVDDSSILLSWSTPISSGGPAITDYIIEYKLTTGGVWTVFPDGTNTNTTATVTGLSNDNSYTFRVYSVNISGSSIASPTLTITPGPPAQVIIQSFSDLTSPSIGTNIRITNEGVSVYEYTYTWCVTDSDVNLCGGGNDVFNSTAAKLILPLENFDTTLLSTVPVAGNYWFHLRVDFGSDSSYASQSFTSTNEAINPPSGGGGGGGGATNPTILPIINNTCNGADFNGDNKVNSIDFSILLTFWRTLPPFRNNCVDINRDNNVNSVDFSILLYQWGKTPIKL